jgi:hypothetical protein
VNCEGSHLSPSTWRSVPPPGSSSSSSSYDRRRGDGGLTTVWQVVTGAVLQLTSNPVASVKPLAICVVDLITYPSPRGVLEPDARSPRDLISETDSRLEDVHRHQELAIEMGLLRRSLPPPQIESRQDD